MKDRSSNKTWFPFWVDKWIFGSMRIEFNAEERGIWIDLYAIASKDNGYIRANKDIPYPIEQLSGMLIIPKEKLEKAIEGFVEKGKITRFKNGVLLIKKYKKYQFSDRWKREVEKGEKSKEEKQFEDEFKEFWEAYPEKKSKQDALKAFKALRRKGVELKLIMKAHNGYMDFLKKKWKKENFQQKPMYLGTFLRENRWEDYLDEKYTPDM